ncbi:MAG TPA: FAD/NAD(P)-binding protein [Rhodothermales bacterium]|nr:FAD/NAD(P)-binding protein [Rhodothermales bacterium]
MIPEPFTITRRQKETVDTFTIELERESGPFAFQPGQFNMLYAFGVGEVPISISGRPFATDRLVHTIRDVGTVTTALGKLKTGDQVGVRGPFGSSWPTDLAEGKDVIVAAGGIGLAPIRPAIEQVLAHREKYGRFIILYGARTPESILYGRDLGKWSARLDTDVLVTVDRASRSWRGHVGVITDLLRNAPVAPENAVVFVCGPEIMMHYVVLNLRGRGFSGEQIFVSLERNMQCAEGRCGRCQLGPAFVCKDGPVFRFTDIEPYFGVREF